jgi:hypothetical protein
MRSTVVTSQRSARSRRRGLCSWRNVGVTFTMGRDAPRRIHVRRTEAERACAVATSDAVKINPASVHVCFNLEIQFVLQLFFSMNSKHV